MLTTGDNWGLCDDGSGVLGCGPQVITQDYVMMGQDLLDVSDRYNWGLYNDGSGGLGCGTQVITGDKVIIVQNIQDVNYKI